MRILAASLLFGVLAAPALAGQVLLPAQGLERDRTIEVAYRLSRPQTGKGVLDVEWRDALGRVVAHFANTVELSHTSTLHFSLDLRRAVAVGNELRVRLLLAGDRKDAGSLAFAIPPRDDRWRDYQIIMWQQQTAQQYAALKEIGVTGAAVTLEDRDDPEHLPPARLQTLLAADLRWYIENIATDFYSAYHRWAPDRPVNWRFQQIKRLYAENPHDPASFIRDPSLSDTQWLQRVRDRLARTVHGQSRYRPLFYNLADEPGIADLSIFWDFDLAEPSLKQMRTWLQRRYGSLAALNRQWESDFRRWDQVMPMTTSEAIARGDDNYSAWADFKEWMDESFARALRAGRDALHAASTNARAAIEGAQIPGWGGYDYTRLADSVDVMELYDDGGNLEILRSLNPSIILLTTLRVDDANRVRNLWRALLRGTRGAILWDPENALAGRDGSPGAAAQAMESEFREIRGGLGALLINSRRQMDPIAVLYSPASMRTEWLLDWKPKGDAWAKRELADSYEDENPVRSSMMGYVQGLERMGLHPRLISPEGLASGELRRGDRLLILPRAIALSRSEARAIRRFVARGGTVVADTEPGLFDEHGRRLPRPALHELFADAGDAASSGMASGKDKRIYLVPDAAPCEEPAARDACAPLVQVLQRIFGRQGVSPAIDVRGTGGDPVNDVEIYRFQNGGVTIIGLQRGPEGALTASERDGNVDRPAGASVVVTLPRPAFVYDLSEDKLVGRIDRLETALDPVKPRLFALASAPLPRLSIEGPNQIRAGETAEFHLQARGSVAASIDVLHVDVVDPAGRIVPHYGGNLLATQGRASFRIPVALNDSPGVWTIRVRDVLGCQTETSTLAVATNGRGAIARP